jgi:hypothetical protein
MAITFANAAQTTNTTGVIALTSAAGAGDLLVLTISQFPASSPVTYAATDSANTGGWTFPSPQTNYNGTLPQQVSMGFKVCNASGSTPTITVTGGSGSYALAAARFTGFVSTATLVAADASVANSASGTAVNSGSFNATKNSELIVATCTANSGFTTTPPTGWSNAISASASAQIFYQTGVASGTAESLSGTLASAAVWFAAVQGFYDAVAAGTGVPYMNYAFQPTVAQ